MDLSNIAKVPQVRSVLECEASGALLGAVREPDPESAAAVTGFIASGVGQIGEELGLGPLFRVSVVGRARATLLVVLSDSILSAAVEPATAFAAAERAVDSILQG